MLRCPWGGYCGDCTGEQLIWEYYDILIVPHSLVVVSLPQEGVSSPIGHALHVVDCNVVFGEF